MFMYINVSYSVGSSKVKTGILVTDLYPFVSALNNCPRHQRISKHSNYSVSCFGNTFVVESIASQMDR